MAVGLSWKLTTAWFGFGFVVGGWFFDVCLIVIDVICCRRCDVYSVVVSVNSVVVERCKLPFCDFFCCFVTYCYACVL